ncbi:hypothetical protein [Methylocystis sp.]|uniref:hypothetical protein n=1 Tax=Methylocystis sp. TaxID=1911079 RepID=UPI003D0A7AE5
MRKTPVPKPVDPIAILESIARNPRLKPTPRVQAAKELLRFCLSLAAAPAPAEAKAPEARKAEKTDRLAEELNRRALSMMNTRGTA